VPLSNAPDDERKSRFGLRTLLDTSRLLIESHDIDFILNNLLLITMGKLMVNRAAILWFQPKKNIHTLRTSKGRHSLPAEVSIRRDLFKNQATALCADNPELDHVCKHGFELLIAIRNSERHFGFLALGPRMDRSQISSEEVEVLESLVSMSAIAVSNSELVSELRATNRKLDYKIQELFTLFDLSKSFNASIDRDEIKRIFKFTLLGQLFVRRFFLITQRHGEPRIESQNGLGIVLTGEQMQALFSLDRSIVMVDDEIRRRHPFLEQGQIHLILKINNEGQEPAVIGLGKRANGVEFEQTDLNFLISLGNLALMSIQKTYLLEDQIEKERMEEELSIARSIQQRLLPDNPPQIPNLQLAATNIPSYQVGGDYYDLLRDDHHNLTMAIADVTGKGVPASLLMANLQSVLHILQPFDISLTDATGQINSLIFQNTPTDKFISFFWGRFDHETRTLRYVNAGHNPPILLRKGSEPELLSEGGVLLGAMPTMMPYKEGEVQLQKGDVVIMYTDGVTEAMDGEEEFDEHRLIACVQKRLDQHPEEIMEGIIREVTEYCGNQFTDDLTLIVCKVV
jgi:phosphoserine phosphatase RsbU/P